MMIMPAFNYMLNTLCAVRHFSGAIRGTCLRPYIADTVLSPHEYRLPQEPLRSSGSSTRLIELHVAGARACTGKHNACDKLRVHSVIQYGAQSVKCVCTWNVYTFNALSSFAPDSLIICL